MRVLALLLLSGLAQAATFSQPYPSGEVQATAWNFSNFKLEINGTWYLFQTVWTKQGNTIGGRTNYESTLVYDSTGQYQAQVVAQLYQYYCGRSKCTVYEPILYGEVTP
jgi:hypothetical protein